MTTHRTRIAPALLAALALLGLTLSACGGSESPATASDSNARDTARLKLQKCLRDNGVDIPAPGQGANGARRVLGNAQSRQKVQKALQGPCKKLASSAFGNITPQQRQEFQDAFVKFSACMRSHGVNVPTPNFGSGPGGGVQVGGGRGTVRALRNTPKFQAAMKQCRSNLPGGGPGGGGAGGGRFFGPGGGPPGGGG